MNAKTAWIIAGAIVLAAIIVSVTIVQVNSRNIRCENKRAEIMTGLQDRPKSASLILGNLKC